VRGLTNVSRTFGFEARPLRQPLHREMEMNKPPILNDDELAAVVNGLAHGLAVFEQSPPHWVRIGETQVVRGILDRLAPPPRRQCDSAVPMPLRVARKHVNQLLKGGVS
jgi:hypothetical protein